MSATDGWLALHGTDRCDVRQSAQPGGDHND